MEHAFLAGVNAKPLPCPQKPKLTETQALMIFSLRPDNPENKIASSIYELAVYYHVTPETIRNIWKGKTWGFETGKQWHPRTPTTNIAKDIDNKLYKWARKKFIHKKLFANDSIPGLE